MNNAILNRNKLYSLCINFNLNKSNIHVALYIFTFSATNYFYCFLKNYWYIAMILCLYLH
jgi:hypothetical protein